MVPFRLWFFVLELPACIFPRKPPVDLNPPPVHPSIPGVRLPPQRALIGDSSLPQALPGEKADLDFRLVQPTPVFRRVVNRESIP